MNYIFLKSNINNVLELDRQKNVGLKFVIRTFACVNLCINEHMYIIGELCKIQYMLNLSNNILDFETYMK